MKKRRKEVVDEVEWVANIYTVGAFLEGGLVVPSKKLLSRSFQGSYKKLAKTSCILGTGYFTPHCPGLQYQTKGKNNQLDRRHPIVAGDHPRFRAGPQKPPVW